MCMLHRRVCALAVLLGCTATCLPASAPATGPRSSVIVVHGAHETVAGQHVEYPAERTCMVQNVGALPDRLATDPP